MKNRFQRYSRAERGKIPKHFREEIFLRDNYTCLYCKVDLSKDRKNLTIDHLIPISAHSGLDEKTNWVTACQKCNQKKADMPLDAFAKQLNIQISKLPITGDLIIDNEDIPIPIRQIRKDIFENLRKGKLSIGGRSAQKKIEKIYRKNLSETQYGKKLKKEFPSLPGPVRAMIPEIQSLTSSEDDFYLMIELAKSASTRNLIGSVITKDCDVMERLNNVLDKSDEALKKRINQAINRFKKNRRKR